MKFKRLLSLVLAAAAVAGVCVFTACSEENQSVVGKTYTLKSITLDSSLYKSAGITPPTNKELYEKKKGLTGCYITFNEDGTCSAKYPTSVNSGTTRELEGYYYEGIDKYGAEYVSLYSTQAAVSTLDYLALFYKDGSLLYREYLYERVTGNTEYDAESKQWVEIEQRFYCYVYFKS